MCASCKCHQRKLFHIPMGEGQVWISVPKGSVQWDVQAWRTGLGSLCVPSGSAQTQTQWGCFTTSLTWRALLKHLPRNICNSGRGLLSTGTTSCQEPISLLPRTLQFSPCEHPQSTGHPQFPATAALASHNQCPWGSPSSDWGAQSKESAVLFTQLIQADTRLLPGKKYAGFERCASIPATMLSF